MFSLMCLICCKIIEIYVPSSTVVLHCRVIAHQLAYWSEICPSGITLLVVSVSVIIGKKYTDIETALSPILDLTALRIAMAISLKNVKMSQAGQQCFQQKIFQQTERRHRPLQLNDKGATWIFWYQLKIAVQRVGGVKMRMEIFS